MGNVPQQFYPEYNKFLEGYDHWNNVLKSCLGVQAGSAPLFRTPS